MLKKYSGLGKFCFCIIVCFFSFCLLLLFTRFFCCCLFLFYLAATMEINSTASSVIRDPNLLILIKKITDNNNKNYMTKLVAEKVDKNSMVSGEISGERVWKEAGLFLGGGGGGRA